MKGSEFVFDYVHLLYYKRHKINPNCGGSCIVALNHKAALIVTLNHEKKGKTPEKIYKNDTFYK